LYRYRYDFMAFFRYLKENKKDTVEWVDKLTIEGYKQFLFSLWPSKYGRYKDTKWLASWTINQKLVVIKKFLEFTRYCYDIGMSPDNVRLNKAKYKRWDYFEKWEIKEILDAVDHTEKYRINQLRLKLIIMVCYVSWTRLNEMRQITIEGIREGKQKILWKWDKYRWVFFNDKCRLLLEEYLKEQDKPLPRIWKTVKRKTNYAIIGHWYNTFGNQIGKQAICEMFKKLDKYLSKNEKRDKHITCHTLRHSFATTCVNNWINAFYLKELMGHEKLNTTAVYYHENRTLLQEEQNRIFA
jgi:integrase/recombinase XerD